MISRRAIMAGGLALPATTSFAEELKGRMRLTMPAGQASDDALRFIVHLGVEWVTMGGPGAPTYSTEGRVMRTANDKSEAPWKEAELVKIKLDFDASVLHKKSVDQ